MNLLMYSTKKCATMVILKKFSSNDKILLYPKRNRTYTYFSKLITNKNIGRKFIEYLEPTIFNSTPNSIK